MNSRGSSWVSSPSPFGEGDAEGRGRGLAFPQPFYSMVVPPFALSIAPSSKKASITVPVIAPCAIRVVVFSLNIAILSLSVGIF
jgi:hypothetical protein